MTTWTITAAQDEDVWLDDLIGDVLAAPDIPLPAAISHLGHTTIKWFSPSPGDALVFTEGGTGADRVFARALVASTLQHHGYEVKGFRIDTAFTKDAHWNDIMTKAKRLLQSGNVQLLRNGPQNIVAHVIGDHGEYNSEISREDPDSQAITQWQCECPWDQFAFQRTRKWKKYEARPCAHVLAAYWKSLSTPLDEDRPPGGDDQGPPAGGQGQLFDQPGAAPPAKPPSPQGPAGGPSQGDQMGLFDQGTGQQMNLFQPPDAGVIPQLAQPLPPYQPGSSPYGVPAPANAVSVPGARPPSPGNPENQGGTFSRVLGAAEDQFINGAMVRLDREEYGLAEGPSEQHGAGQYVLIPQNSIGEVLGQDPSTGWVDCIFAGPAANNGPLEPYHIRAYVEPAHLTIAGWVRAPGPFIQRA